MELDENGFLEELLSMSMRRESTWDAFSAAAAAAAGIGEFFAAGEGGFDCFMHESQPCAAVLPGFAAAFDAGCSDRSHDVHRATTTEPNFDCLSEVWFPAPPLPPPPAEGALDVGLVHGGESSVCKVEMGDPMAFGTAVGGERKKKKADGVPSKNLMAERRRRKRLNDRLSMLRKLICVIKWQMDRTSILGDTIDYMKELLERIKHLQEEMEVGSDKAKLVSLFKDQLNPNEILVRNSPKFDVERRESDTRIEIYCAMKPGLLLQMVDTLDALGLEIQQCVVSCFNEFGMQASCSEVGGFFLLS
ncbi:Transcription factor bHLH93 [Ananas comosus]|uniref:Transcription factor bHLH93 n=1 Tax=Ananas comosus TaxID=4615 RepID=A0A199VKZ8_ANACO|nr:Transcription factor bHLH93 [Ananas comosus]